MDAGQMQPIFWRRWGWLPVPLLCVSLAVFWGLGLKRTYEWPWLLVTLNFTFSTLVSLAVAMLAARGFLMRPAPGILLLGCGVLTWGLGSIVASVVWGNDVNVMV